MIRRLSLVVAVAVGALMLLGAGGGSQPTPKIPAKDRFTGHVSAGTGRYRGDHGRARLAVFVSLSASGATITIRIAPLACRSTPRCLGLKGSLSGRLGWLPVPSDSGSMALLNLSGKVAPLGNVTATGTVHGTGFIVRGRETLTLTLPGTHGTVKLAAQSGLVRGFTTP
jgi:hypothetical protein